MGAACSYQLPFVLRGGWLLAVSPTAEAIDRRVIIRTFIPRPGDHQVMLGSTSPSNVAQLADVCVQLCMLMSYPSTYIRVTSSDYSSTFVLNCI